MDSTQYWIIWIGLHRYVGMVNNFTWREFKREWRQKRNWPTRCSQCHVTVKSGRAETVKPTGKSLTLDHIIPKWLIYELELWELVYDEDNYALLCQKCNGNKTGTILNIDDLSPRLLGKYHAAINRRNNEFTSVT